MPGLPAAAAWAATADAADVSVEMVHLWGRGSSFFRGEGFATPDSHAERETEQMSHLSET